MEEIQNVRKSLPRRIAVATAAGLLAVVAGLGMAPAGAAEGIDKISFEAASFDLEADIDTKGDKLGAEVSGEAPGCSCGFSVRVRNVAPNVLL